MKSKRYEYHGELLTVVEISTRRGLSVRTIRKRIRNKIDFDADLKAPNKVPRPRKRQRVFYKGAERTTHEIAELDGVHYQQAAKIVREIRKQNG